MSQSDLEVSGFDEVTSRLRELGSKTKRVENKAVRAGARIVYEKMIQEVPVSDINEPGHVHIKDDIKMSGIRRAKEATPTIMVGPSKKTAWRAKFLEFGTIKMPPNAFISRAASLSAVLVRNAIANEIRKGLGLK